MLSNQGEQFRSRKQLNFNLVFPRPDFKLFPDPSLPDPDRATFDDAPPIDGGGDRGGEVDDRGSEVEGRGGDRLPRH